MMIDPKDVVIAWEEDGRGRADSVIVAKAEDLSNVNDMENVRGASVDGDWLTEPMATPAAVFLHLVEMGFRSRSELAGAVAGFANIAGCEWARHLHVAMQQIVRDEQSPKQE